MIVGMMIILELLAYGVSAKDEEFELLQNYTKALNFLYERY